MAKVEDIRVGACLVHNEDGTQAPVVLRCESEDKFLIYDPENPENEGYAIKSLQELVVDYNCMDHIPAEWCEEDIARAPKQFQR